MKKPGLLLCLLLVFICAAALADVEINETNFPDAAFRGFLLDKTTHTVDGTRNYYTDDQIAKVTEIICTQKGIGSLKGIEYFTALTCLDCSQNQLQSIDVSKNTALKSLSTIINPMKQVDVSSCPALYELVRNHARRRETIWSYDYWRNADDSVYLGVDLNTKVIAGDFTSESKQIDSVTITMTPPEVGSDAGDPPAVALPAEALYILSYGRLQWLDGNNQQLFEDHVFKEGEVCRALISLTPKEGYIFADNAKVNLVNCDVDEGFEGDLRDYSIIYMVVKVTAVKQEPPPQQEPPQEQQEPPQEQQEPPQEQQEPTQQTEIPATVSLSKTKLTIKGVGTATITATLSNPDDSIISVKSGNTKAVSARFSGNEIRLTSAKQKGKATVTVTTAKGATAKIMVTVKEGSALNEKKVTLKKGKTFKIKVLSIPATVKAKAFRSDKPAVATVDGKGKIKALKKGKATITVTLTNGKTLKLKVTVK